MGEFAVVEVDEGVRSLLDNYSVLIEGNNALELTPIPDFEPIRITPDTPVVPYESKVQELTDKVHQAAVQLREYYDQVANSDARFIPYWNQDIPFTEAVENLPEIQKRKFFEGFEKYCERNNLEERLKLDNQLNYFSPFLKYYDDVKSFDDLKKGFRKGDRIDASGVGLLPFLLSLFAGATGFSSFMMATLHTPTQAILWGAISGVSALSAVGLGYMFNTEDPKTVLLEHAHEPLVDKSKKTDEMISLIHSLAD